MNSETQIKQLWRGFYLLLAVFVVLDPKLLELVGVLEHDPHHDANFVVDGLPEFYPLFGLLICVAMVVFSKLVVAKIVMRPETYYDKSPLDPTRDSKGRPLVDPATQAEKGAH
jgi:hypothetical protein